MNEIYQEYYEAQKLIKEMKKDFEHIVTQIVCIGGPLNDNKLKYNEEQLVVFQNILNTAQYWQDRNDDE